MSPPLYADLGKQARDIFGKGFHFGLTKIDVKTLTSSGLLLNSMGQSVNEIGKVTASLEGKYPLPGKGATLTTKWTSDSLVTSKLDVDNVPGCGGLRLTLEGKFDTVKNVKDGKVAAEYRRDVLAAAADVDLNLSGPIVNTSAVVGRDGLLAGLQMTFDSAKSKLVKNNVALTVHARDFVLHGSLNNGQIFGGSLFKKVHPQCDIGATLGWTASTNVAMVGLGAKYVLDATTCVRAKISNNRQLGLGLQQVIREGVTVTLSALIDGKNFNQGGHQVGLAVELQAL